MKVNLPKRFKLNTGEDIVLKREDIERYATLFYLHVPNINNVYELLIKKGFYVLERDNNYHHLSKGINSLLFDIKLYSDGFIEGSIGIRNQMVNVIYEVYDNYKDTYNNLHIFYKAEWDNRKGWIIDIKQYFRIELPQANTIPWRIKVIDIPSLGL